MTTMKTEVPAGTDEVTLVIHKDSGHKEPTLRDILPLVQGEVELFVWQDYRLDFDRPIGGTDGVSKSACWSTYTEEGKTMIQLLEKSRIVDGEKILGMKPFVRSEAPQVTVTNGSAVLSGNSRVTLHVRL